MSEFIWTPEHEATLRELWPTMRGDEIAQRLGTTKGAVHGKVRRMKLLVKRPSGVKDLPRKPTPAAQFLPTLKKQHAPAPVVYNDPTDVEPLRVQFMDLKSHHCRWICDDGTYCGHQVLDCQSYCPAHYRLTHDPVPPRRSVTPIRRAA